MPCGHVCIKHDTYRRCLLVNIETAFKGKEKHNKISREYFFKENLRKHINFVCSLLTKKSTLKCLSCVVDLMLFVQFIQLYGELTTTQVVFCIGKCGKAVIKDASTWFIDSIEIRTCTTNM